MSLTYKLIAILFVLGALVGLFFLERNSAIDKAVQAAKTELNKEYSEKLEKANKEAKKAQDDFVAFHLNELQDKDEKIKSITDERDRLVSSLSNRPKRSPSANNPISPKDSPSCTGRELYQEDGEFLAREAARADKLIEERDFYYRQYEKARLMLEELNGKNYTK